MKAAGSLHTGQIIVDDGQGDTRSILPKNACKLREIPAGDHFREIQAGFHHVKQPGAAQCAFVRHYRNMIVASHLAPLPNYAPLQIVARQPWFAAF
jgi:hypothetical protein